MTQLSTLLLVDPDPHGLESLTYGFELEGCTVAGTSDPGRVAELVRTGSPQLAVVALRSPDRRNLDLVRTLGNANGRSLPVVTLGPPDLKAAALAAGASDFLPTPLFVRDVISVGKLLALRGPAPPGAGRDKQPEVEIQSRLADYHGLFYLLRALSVAGRSGILIMTRGNMKAELRFSDGKVTGAHVAALQGLQAVHQLLLWEDAALLFKFRPVGGGRSQLHLSGQELLDECERFLRDLAFGARDLGSPGAVYAPAADRGIAASGLQPSQVGPVLRLFDGHRRLMDVIEESPFRVFDTLRVIKRLLDAGSVVAAPGAPGAPDGPRSIMETWAIVPDMRGVVGDRRKSQRKLKPVPPAEAQPIALTLKKAAGEIPPRKRLKTPPPMVRTPPAAAPDIALEPTVQAKLDSTGLPAAAPLVHASPAREPRRPTPVPGRTPAPGLRPDGRKKTTGPLAPVGLTPNTAFDEVEADFFAREADLYRREVVENFDDLDHGTEGGKSGSARPGGPAKKKR